MKIIRTSVIFAGLGLIVVAGSANIARPQSAPPAETMPSTRNVLAVTRMFPPPAPPNGAAWVPLPLPPAPPSRLGLLT